MTNSVQCFCILDKKNKNYFLFSIQLLLIFFHPLFEEFRWIVIQFYEKKKNLFINEIKNCCHNINIINTHKQIHLSAFLKSTIIIINSKRNDICILPEKKRTNGKKIGTR